MAKNYNINIICKTSSSSSGKKTKEAAKAKVDEKAKGSEKAKEDTSKAKTAASVVIATEIAKSALNYASTRVESFSGDSQAQANVNFMFKAAGYAAAFAVNPILATFGIGAEITTTWLDASFQHRWEMVGIRDKVDLLGGLSYGRNRNK